MNNVNEIDESSDEIIDIAEGDEESFDLELDENHDYVYLLHPSPFADKEIPIYKIGRTYRSESRFVSYPKNSIIYHIQRVQNCRYTEKQMIKAFHKYFEHNEKCGDEYFSGKMSRMIKCIKNIVRKIGQEKESDREYEQNLRDKYKNHLRFRTNEINDITGGIIPDNAREILDSGYQREIKKESVTIHTSFKCKLCNKKFKRKENKEYHVRNKACKVKEYVCKYCQKGFTTATSMYRHMKHNCKARDSIEQTELLEKLTNRLECNDERIAKLEKENTQLKKKVVKMEKAPKTVYNTSNNSGVVNNGTINNNITIVAYGKEDMSQIDREDIIKALKTGFNSTKQLTEVIHFNPKYPHYSNIKRSNYNMKNKVMFHNGEHWITTSDPHMIDDLYNRKRDFIEENIDLYQDGLNKYDMVRLHRWLNVDDDDHRITRIKTGLREMLFNKKGIAEQNEENLGVTVVDVDEIVESEYVTDKALTRVRKIAKRNGKKKKLITRKR